MPNIKTRSRTYYYTKNNIFHLEHNPAGHVEKRFKRFKRTTNGNRRYTGYVANDLDSVEFSSDRVITMTSNIDGVSDIVVLAAQKINGTDDTLYGGLKWNEIHT